MYVRMYVTNLPHCREMLSLKQRILPALKTEHKQLVRLPLLHHVLSPCLAVAGCSLAPQFVQQRRRIVCSQNFVPSCAYIIKSQPNNYRYGCVITLGPNRFNISILILTQFAEVRIDFHSYWRLIDI